MYFPLFSEFTGQIGYVDASINSYAWLYHNKNTSSGTDRVYIPEKANKNRGKEKNGIIIDYSDLFFKLFPTEILFI